MFSLLNWAVAKQNNRFAEMQSLTEWRVQQE